MLVKILLENSDDMKWVAVLLGSGAETEDRIVNDPPSWPGVKPPS
jgi:AI-2 transport protein TqsA